MGNNNEFQETPCTDECYVRISDLKKAILENPYDPAKGEISGYLRYLKYNTPFRTDAWIPCSERLPEKDGRYLCTVGAEYRNPREMIYAPQEWKGKSDDATWKDPSGYYVYDWFVKAWMPIPESYRG